MNLFVFGLGYSARHFVEAYGRLFDSIAATARDPGTGRGDGISMLRFGPDGADPSVEQRLGEADVLLVSVPPGSSSDPVLARYGRRIAATKRPQLVLYLSTIGVYGDRGGEWVDEEALPTPLSERSKVRVQAEKAWATLSKDRAKTVHLLRLSGIYGPGRNPLVNLAQGRAHRYVKPGQVFNRIHVDDIAATLAALVARPAGGGSHAWNVTDDEPAPPQDVVTYAAAMMGIEPPPAQDFATAELSAMARSFYGENKRCSNRRIKEMLGVVLSYPTYREGIAALWAAGEGRVGAGRPPA